MPILNPLEHASFFSVLIPLFFLFRKKENFKNAVIKTLSVLLFVSVFSDLLSLLMRMADKSSTPVVNIYFIAQFIVLSFMYYYLLNNKKVIYVALTIFLFFSIFNIVFFQPFTEFQNWPRTLGSIILIIYSIIYFMQILQSTLIGNLFRQFPFWFNIAVFYYFGASFLIFLCRNYLLKTQSVEFATMIWGFHNVNNLLKNILFTIAIYWAGVNQKEENTKYK